MASESVARRMKRTPCDRCGTAITADEARLGWPVARDDGYVCPACYGHEAHCACGAVLSAQEEGSTCRACAREAARPYRAGAYSYGDGGWTRRILSRHSRPELARKAARSYLAKSGNPATGGAYTWSTWWDREPGCPVEERRSGTVEPARGEV